MSIAFVISHAGCLHVQYDHSYRMKPLQLKIFPYRAWSCAELDYTNTRAPNKKEGLFYREKQWFHPSPSHLASETGFCKKVPR